MGFWGWPTLPVDRPWKGSCQLSLAFLCVWTCGAVSSPLPPAISRKSPPTGTRDCSKRRVVMNPKSHFHIQQLKCRLLGRSGGRSKLKQTYLMFWNVFKKKKQTATQASEFPISLLWSHPPENCGYRSQLHPDSSVLPHLLIWGESRWRSQQGHASHALHW